jgi:hypothetical protein
MIDATKTRIADVPELIAITRGIPTQATSPTGELPVFSLPDLQSRSEAGRFISGPELAATGVRIPQPGDTLISLEGASVGDTFTVPDGSAEFVPSQQVAVVRVLDRSALDPWYLGAWLATEEARGQMRRLARGAAVQRIPVKDLAALDLPPWRTRVYVARGIGEQFRTFQNAIKTHQDIVEHLKLMRSLGIAINFNDDL